MSARGYIYELCVALRHKWQPQEKFVIFTAYMDEADTHSKNPTIIMSAYLGHAYQWRRFELKLARVQKEFGFKVFHAKDFKARSQEFSGWSDQKCAALISELSRLVEENLTEGLAVHLEHARYLSEYKSPPVPKKMRLDSHYGVCFRMCLARIIHILEQRGSKDKLNVVIERGHKNVGDCERIFNDFKTMWRQSGIDMFGAFTIERKDTAPPLMVADMLAAAYSMMRERQMLGDTKMADLILTNPKKGALAFIELAPTALVSLKEGYEAARRYRAAYWHSQRAKTLPQTPFPSHPLPPHEQLQ